MLEWGPHPNAPDQPGGVTLCRRYSVSTLGEGQWQAWRMVPDGSWFAPLAQRLPDEAAAKAVCERDCE